METYFIMTRSQRNAAGITTLPVHGVSKAVNSSLKPETQAHRERLQHNSQNLEIPERETETPGQGQGARARTHESQEIGNSTHTDPSSPNLVTQVSKKTDSRVTRSEIPARTLVTPEISNNLDLSRFDGPLGQLPLVPLPSRAVTTKLSGDA